MGSSFGVLHNVLFTGVSTMPKECARVVYKYLELDVLMTIIWNMELLHCIYFAIAFKLVLIDQASMSN